MFLQIFSISVLAIVAAVYVYTKTLGKAGSENMEKVTVVMMNWITKPFGSPTSSM